MTLMEYVPPRHRTGPVGDAQAALQPLLDAMEGAEVDFVRQLWPSTATWGLALWENALGLSTDITENVDYRRSRIVSKLRGNGTTTVALIQNVSESYTNGDVDVIEYPAEYRFEIKFVGAIGIPPNLDDLKAAIEEIKPAHLQVDYVIIYRTWDMVAAYTWGDLSTHTWDDVREGDL